MKLNPLYLYALQKAGEDALGNPIQTQRQIHRSEGFFSSWNNRELAADNITLQANGRPVTVDNRKIVTICPREKLDQAEKVQLDGKYYTIRTIEGDDSMRWRVLIVNRYGTDAL